MKTQTNLEGVIIALPTPLLANEDVDVKSLGSLLDYIIQQGANGVMVAGTMGEGAALTDIQRQLLIETTITHCAGRIPVLATVSSVSTRRSIEFAKVVDKAGADFLVCTTPFYNKFPDPESVIIHLEKLADATATPLIFYNAPGATGNAVNADTLERILNMDKVYGVKDSSGDFHSFSELLRRYPNKSERPGTIMQGDESVFDASLLMGADGVVTGGGVVFIALLNALYKAGKEGNKERVFLLQREFFAGLQHLLGENLSRDWVFNIKRRLVDLNVIDHAFATAPFLTNG